MDDVTLFQFIGDSIDGALNAYVNTAASSVIATFITLAVSMTALYYVLMGYMMMLGRVESPWSNLIVSAGKFLLISTFALNAGSYMTWVVEAIRGLEVGLTAAFSGSNGTAPDSVYGVIDASLTKGWALSGELWEKAANRGWRETGMALGEYFNAVIIALATIIIALPAGAMILTAKALLSLMLGIGPLFIMLLMWPMTKQFFDRWIGTIFTALLQIALLAAVLSFAMGMFEVVVNAVDVDSDTDSPFFGALLLLSFTIIMLYLLYTVQNYAAQLAGGISSSAVTFGQLARGAMSPARAINAPSTRRDMQSGMMVTGGRLNHLVAGNTMWNPAYRQHVMQNMGKNWGRSKGGKVSSD